MTRYPKSGRGRRWTVAELKAIPQQWRGDTLSDGDGLSGEVRVAADGAVSVRWKYAFRWDDKVTWYQAGTWPASSLEEIRSRRDDARRLVSEGINPNVRKQADRVEAQRQAEAVLAAEAQRTAQDLTFRAMFESWVKDGVARCDGNAEIRRSFERDVLPPLGTARVRQVTDSDLREVLHAIVLRDAKRTACVAHANLRQMFKWAEKRQPWRRLLADGNPAELVDIRIVVGKDYDINNVRERVLSDDELKELRDIFVRMERQYRNTPPGKKYEIARPLKETSQLALWICLSTLSRIGETLMAEWEHVDFQQATWFIPKENVKGEDGKTQDHLVFLSPFALGQFKALHALTGDSQWLFPARHVTDMHVDVKSVTKQVGDRQEMFKERARPLARRSQDNSLVLSGGANGCWTPHDMRRTGSTLMQRLGVQDHIIDRCQNHALGGSKVRRAYLHHPYDDEKKSAWGALGAHLDVLLRPIVAKPPNQAQFAPACPSRSSSASLRSPMASIRRSPSRGSG